MFTQDTAAEMGALVWKEMCRFTETQYITHEGSPHINQSAIPDKPFYRAIMIMVHVNPPHFRLKGLRRHLTEDEVLQLAEATHEFFGRHLGVPEHRERFLWLYRDTCRMYEPEDWK